MNADLRGIGMTSQRTRDRLIQRLRETGIRDERVLSVMRDTPRHLFVDEALASRAYEDTALPIGQGQTISQPYIVARMTEALLEDNVPQKVLEVGTGSGYQTAILAQLVPEVYTVERIAGLQDRARQRLAQLKLRNIHYKRSDGTWGWSQHAPYDGILVTAAPEQVPADLLKQLVDGGRMVIPSGPAGQQTLRVLVREDDTIHETELGRVSFVPLVKGDTQ
ncbi:MAG: protein-L-isoaspartate(D-aspartate) O-methyltransferase [Proteobacteria bacterium]|jgi:protein-L-isoaspartate(D-aspartate) O-methyltransferase|nr:protein-L-isoaspartate(D-aspartate) O-methyltransferase [Pseudomonadota bacterium]MCG6934286.1 protein-L-isoaspartate(D-aspartate) O-methyltransferase [Pseudomonadota bacterium]